MRKLVGVGDEGQGTLLLIGELLEGEEDEGEPFARALGRSDDEVVDLLRDGEDLLLEVGGVLDAHFLEPLGDVGVVGEQ